MLLCGVCTANFDLYFSQLINELSKNVADEDMKENRKILGKRLLNQTWILFVFLSISGYKHTSLAPYVENFERFVELAVSAWVLQYDFLTLLLQFITFLRVH